MLRGRKTLESTAKIDVQWRLIPAHTEAVLNEVGEFPNDLIV